MLKYFKTDFRRVFSRTSTKVFWIISIIFVLFVNSMSYLSLAGKTNLLSPGENVRGFTSSEFLILIAFQAIFTTIPYITFIAASYVYVEEDKERGILRAVECGISKRNIVISKFIESIIISIIYAVVVIGFHILIVKILYGLDGDSLHYIMDLIKTIGLLALPLISLIACMNFLSLQIKGELISSIITVLYGTYLHTILRYLGLLFKSGAIQKVATFMPSAIFRKLASIVNTNGIANVNFLDYKIYYITSVFFIILFISLSIITVNKRDLDY